MSEAQRLPHLAPGNTATSLSVLETCRILGKQYPTLCWNRTCSFCKILPAAQHCAASLAHPSTACQPGQEWTAHMPIPSFQPTLDRNPRHEPDMGQRVLNHPLRHVGRRRHSADPER
ncbi:hypothetical protein E2C01_043473 [Portunus trituberculatus]|uniref:Uncharacterized protein n=1 Tax=Portunus trituberculatus TaxID=210409 RepID=A0A5B7FXF3_PORTR|nr:hypothetical protein [Portunus trituberculatus]